ncbi:GIY-YIG nuclease family protein [Prochlorococcus sp. MIT 1300]|uniref:GIY-YIG nuclease family protein n=1 Tax=Prochlorococcus sp. MIT 1300 TaxID=3096218 RepID=UPI0039BFB024
MKSSQGQLFPEHSISDGDNIPTEIKLTKEVLIKWQRRVQFHQSKLFKRESSSPVQKSLIENNERKDPSIYLNPLKLTPLPLSFWRWPSNPHEGPALYLVMDRPTNFNTHLLLYIGETIAADRRWKGDHDCKSYLAAYTEALSKAGLESQLSIRFYTDVPEETKHRRKLEQHLIQLWLPPFNKETRGHWATPFTANIK